MTAFILPISVNLSLISLFVLASLSRLDFNEVSVSEVEMYESDEAALLYISIVSFNFSPAAL